MSLFSYLCLIQGGYYLATGVWPLVSIDTFQKVTGPKTDLWLVKTVGVLIAIIGCVLILAGVRSVSTPEILVLAVGSALGLTGIDVVYVAKKIISPIYLLDAVAELILVAAWLAVTMSSPSHPETASQLVAGAQGVLLSCSKMREGLAGKACCRESMSLATADASEPAWLPLLVQDSTSE